MTRGEIRQLVRDLLGAPLPSSVRDDDATTESTNLNRYINNALYEMGLRLGGYESSATVTLVNGTRLYNTPTGFIGAIDVRYVRQSNEELPLTWMLAHERLPTDYRDYTAEPTTYYFEAGQIGLYPIPNAAADSKTLRILGYYEPTDLTADNTSPAFPRATHRPMAHLAAALICEAQSRIESQGSDSIISADSVNQESRSRNFHLRGKELREAYDRLLFAATGPVI
jgi:hypothetical protein